MTFTPSVDDKVLNATFARLQDWLKGQKNPSIDSWFDYDAAAYENFLWVNEECAKNGWINPDINMLQHATPEVREVAEDLWRSAMAYSERDPN